MERKKNRLWCHRPCICVSIFIHCCKFQHDHKCDPPSRPMNMRKCPLAEKRIDPQVILIYTSLLYTIANQTRKRQKYSFGCIPAYLATILSLYPYFVHIPGTIIDMLFCHSHPEGNIALFVMRNVSRTEVDQWTL